MEIFDGKNRINWMNFRLMLEGFVRKLPDDAMRHYDRK